MADDSTVRQRHPSRNYPPADAPSRAAETDPLSELARLIGQTNPFGEARAPRANSRDQEWPGTPAADASYAEPLPLTADYRGEEQYDQYSPPPAGEYAEYPAEHYDPQTEYGQPHPGAPYYGDNGQHAAGDPYSPYSQEQYEYEEPAPRRRSGLITIAAVLALAALGAAGAYAYRTYFSSGIPAVPPLIKADSAPNKVVPTQQTGDGAANKQIYDRVGSGGQTEKIVSREEQPVDVKPANARPAYVPAPNAGGAPPASIAAAAGQLPTAWPNPPGAVATAPGNPQGEPRKVRTVTIRPDQATTASQTAAPAPVPTQRAPVTDLAPPTTRSQGQPVQPVQQPAPRASSNAPLSLTPQAAIRSASADPRTATATAPRAPVQTSTGSGGYVVQLSAQKSEGEASAAFRSAQSRYPDLLANRQLIVRRKEIAGKGTFYGAQVGPFASREDATQLCEQLKSAGGTCLVQKN